jgi:hypothetical protein
MRVPRSTRRSAPARGSAGLRSTALEPEGETIPALESEPVGRSMAGGRRDPTTINSSLSNVGDEASNGREPAIPVTALQGAEVPCRSA